MTILSSRNLCITSSNSVIFIQFAITNEPSKMVFYFLSFCAIIFYRVSRVLGGHCYYEICYCPGDNQIPLKSPGDELLLKLQDLRRNQSLNNLYATYSEGIASVYLQGFTVVKMIKTQRSIIK